MLQDGVSNLNPNELQLTTKGRPVPYLTILTAAIPVCTKMCLLLPSAMLFPSFMQFA